MNYDFSKPQRQSAVGIIIMAANTLQHLIRALIFPLIFAFAKADKQYLAYIGLGVLVYWFFFLCILISIIETLLSF
ncbi:hypothetical protein [Pedobacter boryungensis]|uniref:hypothetical protein n=1 Tax=Pedobacter boryungensis TaxID=869962 RepID=UPI001C204C84|nr:hypothetical protein [Pedobacter boryungensis]